MKKKTPDPQMVWSFSSPPHCIWINVLNRVKASSDSFTHVCVRGLFTARQYSVEKELLLSPPPKKIMVFLSFYFF